MVGNFFFTFYSNGSGAGQQGVMPFAEEPASHSRYNDIALGSFEMFRTLWRAS